MGPVGRGRALSWLLAAAALSGGAWLALVAATPAPGPLLARAPRPLVEVVDRRGALLRLVPSDEGVRYRPLDPADIPEQLEHAVLAAEDRRFWWHPGVDPAAAVRAAWQNARAGRIVSGGSTLSMQLARILDPRPRGAGAKLRQALLAMRLELSLGKRRILAEYLSRAPMGNRVVGYEAAALVYLGKPAAQLSPAEAALLASVPRAPSRANPWKNPAVLEARRDAVLARMRAAHWLDEASYRAALAERPVLARAPFRMEAPHFVRRVLEETGLQDAGPAAAASRSPSPAGALPGTPPSGRADHAPLPSAGAHPGNPSGDIADVGPGRVPAGAARIVTTLDGVLQSRVEALVRRQLAELAAHGVQQMAVVVLDVRRGEWLALEGSGLDGEAPGRWIDGTRAPRQPGSALKPFTYAAAFDHGFTPATVLPDIPHAFTWTGGTWAPRNYDERWHGPVRAREALACSVNLPAAELLGAIGTDRLLEALRAAGIGTLAGGADAYGLGLTLGAGEVRLDELAQAYAALLRGGEWRPATSWRAALDARGRVSGRPSLPAPRRVFSEEAAAQVSDILADPEARAPAFGLWSVLRLPFPAAVKTGTSEGFRDNWCLGGTRDVVVGVWCGNFNRAPMGNVSGVSGAGAVWREVMLAWAGLEHPEGTEGMRETLVPPPGEMARVPVCSLSGLRPSPACPVSVTELFRRGQEPAASCDWHVRREDGRVAVVWPPLYLDWAVAEGLVDDLDATASASVSADGDEGTRPGAVSAEGGPSGPGGPGGPERGIRARRAPSPGQGSPGAGAVARVDPTRGAPIAVLAPADGDTFLLSPELPRRFQTIELRCSVRGRPAEVTWTIDGKSFARVAAPYSVSWPLSPGEHRIEARAGEQRSRPALVTIYAPAGTEAPQGPPAGAPEGGSPLSRLLPPEDEARVQ